MKKLLHLPLALVLLLFATKTTFTQVYNFSNSTSANGLPSNMTTALIQDFRGYLWVGTENGLARFDGTNFVNYDKFQGLSENAIADLKVDEHGNIFAFHPNKFVTKISKDYNFEIIDSTADKSNLMSTTALQCEIEKKRIIRIKDKRNKEIFSISSKNGLINDHINDAVVGRENILWIASANNGIYSLPLQNFPVYEWPYPDFVSQYRLNAETNLITFKNHIVRLRFNGEKPEYSLVFSSTRKEFNCAVIQFGKQLFYGTDKGMFLYFSETGKEFSFDEMADKNVTHIEKIGNGDLLIIADNKVYRYIVYDNEIELVEGTKNFLAYSIQKVKNTIYVTGKENIYQLKNKKFIPLLNTHEIAKSQDFIHISQTANNELWLSAANGGVFLFNPQSDKLEYFNEEKNLPISATTSTIEENNNLWISAQGEIIWYDIKQNTYSRFGNKYLNEKLFVPFTIRNKENYYFLTREGLVQTFDSESFEGSDNILNITDILVQGLPVASDSLIELKYNSFPIQFNYQSISLKDKTYYQVKLEGKDKDWSTSTLKTTSSYEKLEPGDYTFRVRTTGPINEVVLNTEKIKFTVLQPYWKTAIFFYILLIVISVLVLMFYVFRILTLKRRSEKLEKLINEKTYVLSAQNQNIEQFSYSLSHDLKNPINNIKGLVEIMEESEDEGQNEIKNLLMSSAQLLEDKIKATLKTIKQMQANKKNVELLYFNNLVTDTKRSLLILIKENDVKFITNFKVASMRYSGSILESVFYNLISNSIKYGAKDRKTIVTISSRKEGDITILEFEDNGIGIDMEKDLEKLFSIFERVDDENATGTGLGLYMVKQMIELNGGSISVASEVGKGTKFTIKLASME